MKALPEIPWLQLAGHLSWVAGVALVLASFGWHEWLARCEGLRLGDVLKRPSFLKALAAGGVLAALGAGDLAANPLIATLAVIAAIGLGVWLWKLMGTARR